jgi:hypothetical protein
VLTVFARCIVAHAGADGWQVEETDERIDNPSAVIGRLDIDGVKSSKLGVSARHRSDPLPLRDLKD